PRSRGACFGRIFLWPCRLRPLCLLTLWSTFARRASVDNLRVSTGWLANRSSPRARRAKVGADDQDRTGDLVLTKDALCQLSYIGLRAPRYGPTSRLSRSALRPDTSSSALCTRADKSARSFTTSADRPVASSCKKLCRNLRMAGQPWLTRTLA